jgi:hypothetical protein
MAKKKPIKTRYSRREFIERMGPTFQGLRTRKDRVAKAVIKVAAWMLEMSPSRVRRLSGKTIATRLADASAMR